MNPATRATAKTTRNHEQHDNDSVCVRHFAPLHHDEDRLQNFAYETPFLVSQAHRLLLSAIDSLSGDQKTAYLRACNECPQLMETEAAWVDFLRVERFAARPAAQRIIEYWQKRHQLFGARAFRPLVMTGAGALDDEDIRLLRQGWLRYLPERANGHRVLLDCTTLDDVDGIRQERCRFYMLSVGGSRTEWLRVAENEEQLLALVDNGLANVLPVQVHCEHYCLVTEQRPKDSFWQRLESIMTTHPTSATVYVAATVRDLAHALYEAGFSTGQLPISVGGEDDNRRHHHYLGYDRWMVEQLAKEERLAEKQRQADAQEQEHQNERNRQRQAKLDRRQERKRRRERFDDLQRHHLRLLRTSMQLGAENRYLRDRIYMIRELLSRRERQAHPAMEQFLLQGQGMGTARVDPAMARAVENGQGISGMAPQILLSVRQLIAALQGHGSNAAEVSSAESESDSGGRADPPVARSRSLHSAPALPAQGDAALALDHESLSQATAAVSEALSREDSGIEMSDADRQEALLILLLLQVLCTVRQGPEEGPE